MVIGEKRCLFLGFPLLAVTVCMVVRIRVYPVDHHDCCNWCCQHSGCHLLHKTGHLFSADNVDTILCSNIGPFPGILNHRYRSIISLIHNPKGILKNCLITRAIMDNNKVCVFQKIKACQFFLLMSKYVEVF